MRLSSLLWLGGALGAVAVAHTHPEATSIVVIDAALVSFGVGYALGATGQQTAQTEAQPVARTIPNLSEAPNGFEPIRDLSYEYKTDTVKERDPRLKQWAYAVAYNNAPMTQKKWAGRKRLFSRPEYERWINCLTERQVTTFVNPLDPSRGYKPNGAAGWMTIKNIADGREYIPLPVAVLSQEQMRYVSARMRERYAVGEGND